MHIKLNGVLFYKIQAITGDTVKLRFEKAKNELEQSLSQLQSMVPVALASEVSHTALVSSIHPCFFPP